MSGGNDSMSVFVIGAGVSGLAFAKAYPGAQVLEALSSVGGKAASFTVDTSAGPFRFDIGGHWFHHQHSPDVLKLLSGLSLLKHERQAYVLIDGQLYSFPIQNSYKQLPNETLIAAIDAELLNSQSREREPRHYDELLLHTYGRTLYEMFFRDYNKKMYGVTDLSAILIGKYDAVRNVPLHNKKGYNSEFYYPADNSGAMGIPSHLSKGLSISYNCPVQSIHLKSKTLRIHDKIVKWDKLISTIPLTALVKMIVDFDPAMLELSCQLEASKGFILNIGIKKTSNHHKIDWVYIPSLNYHFHRVGFYSHVQPLAAPAGYDAMYVECSPLFFSNKLEAHSLIPIVIQELITLGFIAKEEDVATVNPVYLEHNYCLPNPEVTSFINGYLNEHDLFSIGRYGSWHWSGQYDDMQQAIQLASRFEKISFTF